MIPTSISSTQVMLNFPPSQPSQAVQLLLKAPLEDTLHTACHKVRPCGWSETHLEVVDLEWFRWDMIRTFWKCGKDFGLVKYDPLNSFDILDQGERHTANLSLSARATCQWSTSCWRTKQFLGCFASCWDDEHLETTFSGGLEAESTNKKNLFYLLIGSCRFFSPILSVSGLESHLVGFRYITSSNMFHPIHGIDWRTFMFGIYMVDIYIYNYIIIYIIYIYIHVKE